MPLFELETPAVLIENEKRGTEEKRKKKGKKEKERKEEREGQSDEQVH